MRVNRFRFVDFVFKILFVWCCFCLADLDRFILIGKFREFWKPSERLEGDRNRNLQALRGCSYIMSYRLGVGGVSQSMTHYDREGGGGKTNYDV